MRKAMLISIAVAAAAAGCSQGRAEDGGPTVQRSYQVGNFQRMEVAGPYDVRVRTGANPGVTASGPEKLLDRLVVEVKGDRLLIHPENERRGFFHWGSGVRGNATLEVTVPALREASIAGSGGISVDKVQGNDFEGSIAGSGDLNVDSLNVQSLKLSIAGSGDVRAHSGQAQRADYSIAGSGGIDARAVQAQTADVSIAGSGSVNAQASGTADVSIMGSGDVVLTGGAKCHVSKAGSGDVRCS
jgi:hypothetical protein